MLFAAALAAVLAGVALPLTNNAIDDLWTLAAARYIAGRIVHGRIDAVKRSTAVALRFEPSTPDCVFTPYADGNGNGVRAADIHRGVDPPVGVPHQLGDNFAGVRFGLLPGLPDVDGVTGGGLDGVRIGSARILTMSSSGTATSGTLYLQGRRAQMPCACSARPDAPASSRTTPEPERGSAVDRLPHRRSFSAAGARSDTRHAAAGLPRGARRFQRRRRPGRSVPSAEARGSACICSL